ncbi:MAG: hypothetical protein ACE5KW_04490 [Dehalococcoidia bacterium]
MRLRNGLILGLIIGVVGALLFAPAPDEESDETKPERDLPARDPLARLRLSLKSIRRQAEEAWGQAREAAREAEEEMRERYRQSLRRSRRRR